MKAGDEREWEAGWEGHARAQRRRMARLPLEERLQWLEDAHRLVRHLRRPDPVVRTPLDEPEGRADPPEDAPGRRERARDAAPGDAPGDAVL